MYKTWNTIDERAKIEGAAIAAHNRIRIIPKKRTSVKRPDVTVLEIFVPMRNCLPSINLRRLAASKKHRAILARLKNPTLYKNFRS
jgi:hypothetical protein